MADRNARLRALASREARYLRKYAKIAKIGRADPALLEAFLTAASALEAIAEGETESE